MRWMWIDRVVELVPRERLVAVKNISLAEDHLHDHFGEVRSFTLPNSGILIQHSTKFWKRIDGDPPSTMPDIAVAVLASDYFAGIDRALDITLERPVPGR